MKTNILLPTDFSDNAWTAVLYAIKLNEEVPCRFYFVHSTKLMASTSSSMSSKLTRVLNEKALKDLAEVKQKAEDSSTNTDHKFETILSTYDLIDAMQVVIEKHQIDLIIMGAKGVTKASEILFGSNIVNIIKSVKNCPVLAVPDEFEFKKPKQIAFPTNYKRKYGDELVPLKLVSELYNSKINVVHVNNKEDISEAQVFNLNQLETALENYPHSFHWMPKQDNIELAIKDFIEEFDIDILVMINYQQGFIESIMNEPIIKKLGFQLSIPFLVIPCLS